MFNVRCIVAYAGRGFRKGAIYHVLEETPTQYRIKMPYGYVLKHKEKFEKV